MIISIDFAWIFDILSFFSIGVFLGLIIIEAMGVFGPGGDVDFNTR